MKMKTKIHRPVLLDEAIEGLNIKKNGVYVDATLGRGGHAKAILEKLSNLGYLYGFDQDSEAIEASRERLSNFSPQTTFIHSNFRFIKEELEKINVNKVDGFLFDLGVSSPQIDEKERGFSYLGENNLDMRMDKSKSKDAKNVVNEYSEKDLCKIIKKYGEEKFAYKIAKGIVKKRKEEEIKTTRQLVNVIKENVPYKYFKNSFPSKRVFQAIRIEVNDELDANKIGVSKAINLLNKNGRIAVITFHSLEDKIVKKIFKNLSDKPYWDKNMPITKEEKPKYKLINKKVIIANELETKQNPRAKSAKLRILEKL